MILRTCLGCWGELPRFGKKRRERWPDGLDITSTTSLWSKPVHHQWGHLKDFFFLIIILFYFILFFFLAFSSSTYFFFFFFLYILFFLFLFVPLLPSIPPLQAFPSPPPPPGTLNTKWWFWRILRAFPTRVTFPRWWIPSHWILPPGGRILCTSATYSIHRSEMNQWYGFTNQAILLWNNCLTFNRSLDGTRIPMRFEWYWKWIKDKIRKKKESERERERDMYIRSKVLGLVTYLSEEKWFLCKLSFRVEMIGMQIFYFVSFHFILARARVRLFVCELCWFFVAEFLCASQSTKWHHFLTFSD